MEEGCLSLPGVHVDVERPIHVRVRAQDEQRRARSSIEASGLEARVIQHEIDHLDGVLILDRTPRDQRKEAMRALREALEAGLSHRLPRHLGVRGRRPAALAATATGPALVVTRPDGRRAAAAGSRRRRSPTRRASWASSSTSPSRSTAERPSALAAVARRRRGRVRLRRAGQGAAADRLRVLNVHPSLLPRWRGAAPLERAIMAGDDQTGVSIMRLVAELDAGPVYLAQAEPIAPDDNYGVARRAPAGSRRGCCCGRSTSARVAEQAEDGVTYAEKITAADRTLDPTRRPPRRTSASCARCTRTSAPAWRARRQLPRRPARARRRRRLARAARGPAAGRPADGLRRLPARPRGALKLGAYRAPPRAQGGRRHAGVHEARAVAAAELDHAGARQRTLEGAPLAGGDDPVGRGIAGQHGRPDRGRMTGGGGVSGAGRRRRPAPWPAPSRPRRAARAAGRSTGPAASTTQASGRRTASISARWPPR